MGTQVQQGNVGLAASTLLTAVVARRARGTIERSSEMAVQNALRRGGLEMSIVGVAEVVSCHNNGPHVAWNLDRDA